MARATATALENAKLVSMLSQSLAQAEIKEEESRHRADNAYLAAQSLAHVSRAPEMAEAFTSRLVAFVQTHEAVDKKISQQKRYRYQGADPVRTRRIRRGCQNFRYCEGASLLLDGEQAIVLGVAVNEMLTSAWKNGTGGRVIASWRVDSNCLRFEWRAKHNPPAASVLATESFDPQVLQRLIKNRLSGTLRYRLSDSGIICEIEFPLAGWV